MMTTFGSYFSSLHSFAAPSIRANDTAQAKLTDYGQVVVRQIMDVVKAGQL